MLLRQFDDQVRILHLSAAEATPWRERFAEAYCRIFREPPYEEDISLKQAGRVWDELTHLPDAITLLAVDDQERVLGFGIAVPIRYMRKVSAALAGLIPTRFTMYLAELGVVPELRSRGLGNALVFERLKLINSSLYSHVVLRVSEARHRSLDMYRALGFEDMGVHMDVTARRLDGTERADRRLFLSRVLSQVDVE